MSGGDESRRDSGGGADGAFYVAMRLARLARIMDPTRVVRNLTAAQRRQVMPWAVDAAGWFTRLAAELQRAQAAGCARCSGEGCAFCEAQR